MALSIQPGQLHNYWDTTIGETPPIETAASVLKDGAFEDTRRGKAEQSPTGESPVPIDYWGALREKLTRHEIRRRTARSISVCLDLGIAIPRLSEGQWLSAIEHIEEDLEAKGRGNLLEMHGRILDADQEKTPRAAENRFLSGFRNLARLDLRNELRVGAPIAEKIEDAYKKNRKNKQFHSGGEGALERIQEKLGPIKDALHQIRIYTELHPEWKREAELHRQQLKQIDGMYDAAESLPSGPTEEMKADLREKRNELKAQSSAKAVLMKAAEKGESPPPWEELAEGLKETKGPGRETTLKFKDVSNIHIVRCRAVAQIDINDVGKENEITTVQDVVERAKNILGDPTLATEKLRSSLNQLELQSGESVYYTTRRNPTDAGKLEAIRERIERARRWCKERSIPYEPTRLPERPE
jgi:hypothetical protein